MWTPNLTMQVSVVIFQSASTRIRSREINHNYTAHLLPSHFRKQKQKNYFQINIIVITHKFIIF